MVLVLGKLIQEEVEGMRELIDGCLGVFRAEVGGVFKSKPGKCGTC